MSRPSLTKRQCQILLWIVAFMRDHGFSPTLREICAAMNIRSTNGVSDHLRALEKKGYIARTSMFSRSIVLIDPTAPRDTLAKARAVVEALYKCPCERTATWLANKFARCDGCYAKMGVEGTEFPWAAALREWEKP